MPNNIAVSITADVADLQVKRAILSAELKTAQKDLNDFAKTARTSGATDALRTQMLAAADSTTRLRNQIGLIDREVKGLGAGAAGAEALASGAATAEKAMGGLHTGTAGVTRELIVLAREAGRGNFSRMAGSATILAQRMGLLTPEVLMAGVAIGALVAPVVAVIAAIDSSKSDLARFQNDIELTGNYAGLTAGQYEAMARRVAKASDTGIGGARAALAVLAASGRFTGVEMEDLGRDAEKMSQMTGESVKQVLADFVRMADGPAKYAEEFNRTHHALSAAQLEHIRNLEDEGRKSEATAALVQDLTHWFDDQQAHMGGLSGAWHGLATAIDNAWESFKRFNQGPSQDEVLAQKQAQLKSLQTTGTIDGDHFYGKDRAAIEATLQREIAAIQAKAAADRQAADQAAETARITQAGTDAYDKSHATLLSLKSSAEQAEEAVKSLHAEMAARLRANPNDAEAEDYMKNHERFDAALRHRMDPGDFKKPDKGPDVVQQWQEAFRAAQVSSNDFFGDETEKELAFWRSKIGLTTQGSKEWLQVQGHIYEATKSLARQDYQDHLADLNTRLEIDRDSRAKEQADWAEKLAFIKSKNGEESAEYKNAYREFEAAEREHQRQMAEIVRAGAQEKFNAMKAQLDANRSIREADAGTAISGIQQNARYNPVLGEVQAAQQIAAIRQQLLAKEISDEETLRAADMARQDQIISGYKVDSTEYQKAVQAKSAADQEWAQKLRALTDKAANQQIASQQQIAQAWHATIDPMVSSVGNQFKGLIEGTETWQQAITRIGEDALGVVIGAIERMAEAWIVAQITGQAAQRATAIGQVESYASIAGAAGVASMAGAPFPIDLSAPAFGASMKLTAMALGSFAQGTNVVPSDMIAQIHAGERIIPKADNRALMDAVGAGPGGRSGRGGGDIHLHTNYAPQVVGSGKSFRQQLQDHSSDLESMIRTAVQRLVRNGALRSA